MMRWLRCYALLGRHLWNQMFQLFQLAFHLMSILDVELNGYTMSIKWPSIHEVGRVAELTARSLSSAANSDCSGDFTGPTWALHMCGSCFDCSYYTRTSQQVDWPTICLSWAPFKIDQWPYLLILTARFLFWLLILYKDQSTSWLAHYLFELGPF